MAIDSYNYILNYGNGDQISFGGYYYRADFGSSQIQFSDGVTWTLQDIQDKVWIGTDGNDSINGGIAQDFISGGKGNDTLYGGDGGDYEHDRLDGGDGNDRLIGGRGSDTLVGGNGNDTYVLSQTEGGYDSLEFIDNTHDDQSKDVIIFTNVASTSVTVQAYTSQLLLSYGASGTYGGGGIEFSIDRFSSQYLSANFSITKIKFSDGVTWTWNNVLDKSMIGTDGNDSMYGGSGDDNLDGDDGNDTLYGGDGNDTLFGGLGNDTMYGGDGNDFYTILEARDTVIEKANEGIDTVESFVSYTLGNNVENLVLFDFYFDFDNENINATGNDLANLLIGNGADNRLNGGSGADGLLGGAGNDTYLIDNAGDTVTEKANEGVDTVRSSISYTLGANVENLELTGSAHINATGNNGLGNKLTGNGGNNTLDGKAGKDTMAGRAGDDTYIVDNSGDVVIEKANEGIDTVESSVSYTLGNNVENLTLTGSANINGTGNALANTLTGNDGANILIGGLGKDKLVLTETTAATDTVRIAVGDSLTSDYDTVTGFDLSSGGDKLDLASNKIAADSDGKNGSNVGIIKSHAITDGLIHFDNTDSFSQALSLTAKNLEDVTGYLAANITGGSVAFNLGVNSYVFQDGGAQADTLVQLTGANVTGLSNNGLLDGGVWLV